MATKPPLDKANAINEIDRILKSVSAVSTMMLAATAGLTSGKLYELYALSKVLEELATRGWTASFVGVAITMKASPGFIKSTDDHFELTHPCHAGTVAIHTDIQVATLGSTVGTVTDRSEYHEIDIVAVDASVTGMPTVGELLLGVECKAVANFEKSFVREVLGRRRELSYLTPPLPCSLDGLVTMNANPPSEYRLVFIDPAGTRYAQSPAIFSVLLEHWQP